MAFSNDQKRNLEQLSSTSCLMLEIKEHVLNEWKKRTRAAFVDADELRDPVFVNTMSVYYDCLAEDLSPDYPRGMAIPSSTLASDHGRDRARLTNYSLKEVVHEYQIFRAVLIDRLGESGIRLNAEELRIINASIDESIREAIASFSLVVSALREQFFATLAHDMRDALSAASIAAELIDLETDLSRIKALANKILVNIDRGDEIAQGLLDATFPDVEISRAKRE